MVDLCGDVVHGIDAYLELNTLHPVDRYQSAFKIVFNEIYEIGARAKPVVTKHVAGRGT